MSILIVKVERTTQLSPEAVAVCVAHLTGLVWRIATEGYDWAPVCVKCEDYDHNSSKNFDFIGNKKEF